ncbi:hypothetical protein [Burkholderia cepacia]|uniref:hypothetical protein n=1 Tax=Burkholderia cepacia TaxID=292 RepID=UPI001CF4664E|nr:hypothetical protein [Burkholderia cepacia]MCA8059630.1 hypothetical protein [Burkholderia cepacia]
MTPPLIDMTNPADVLHEVLDDDRAVKEQFAQALDGELRELAAALAACFAELPAINEAAHQAGTMRTALMAGFVFGVLDDVLTSTKLLVAGKLLASSNLMRQVIEGIAMAALRPEVLGVLLQMSCSERRRCHCITVEEGVARSVSRLLPGAPQPARDCSAIDFRQSSEFRRRAAGDITLSMPTA